MENKFYKADLHIHTPASFDYKGQKDDEEYFKIINEAKKKELDIVAFTDHNSINGYKRIMYLKEELIREKNRFSKITDSKQTKSILKKINNKLKTFDNILIIPGLEFEVNNMIHLLIIFNPETKIEIIEKFLKDGGFDSGNMGEAEPSILSKWSILDLLNETSKYDCIVIDAHTDSSKGIFNTIPPSKLRAEAFKSKNLNGICYRLEDKKNELENIFKSSNEYKRDIQPAFLKFSDAHIFSDIGKYCSWFKLSELSYKCLKESFLNPTENITVEKPDIDKILNELISLENSIGMETPDENNVLEFARNYCALNNSGGGYILFGVNNKNNKIGIHDDGITEKSLFKKYSEYFQKGFNMLNCGDAKVTLNYYPLQSSKIILSARVLGRDRFCNVKDECVTYVINKKKLCKLSSEEFQNRVELKFNDALNEKFLSKITKIENECKLIKDYFKVFPLFKKIEKNCVKLYRKVKVSFEDSLNLNTNDLKNLDMEFNKKNHGLVRGDFVYIDKNFSPRLQNAYFRYTAPKFKIKSKKSYKRNTENRIYLIPEGNCIMDVRKSQFYSDNNRTLPYIGLIKDDAYSFIFIYCFLRSSFNLWYLINKIEDINFYNPTIFKKIIIPKIFKKSKYHINILKNIEVDYKEIVKIEHQFLTKKINVESEEVIKSKIIDHNNKVSKLAYDIDKEIYKLFELTDEEIGLIEDNLCANGFFIPNFK